MGWRKKEEEEERKKKTRKKKEGQEEELGSILYTYIARSLAGWFP